MKGLSDFLGSKPKFYIRFSITLGLRGPGFTPPKEKESPSRQSKAAASSPSGGTQMKKRKTTLCDEKEVL